MPAAPNGLADTIENCELGFAGLMIVYVLLMVSLGTLLDTASIILIVVPLFLPLFLPVVEPTGLSLVWFGIVTVIAPEQSAHAGMTGVALGGVPPPARLEADGAAPAGLDECRGRQTMVTGCQRHAAAPGPNAIAGRDAAGPGCSPGGPSAP